MNEAKCEKTFVLDDHAIIAWSVWPLGHDGIRGQRLYEWMSYAAVVKKFGEV